MRAGILALACLACVGHAHQGAEKANPSNALSDLLRSVNPGAGWQPGGAAAGHGLNKKHIGDQVRQAPTAMEEPAVLPAETKELAMALNPVIGYYDPLGLASADFWDQGNEATWGFLRHAEIKHGRVAMAAFIGFCVQANHIHWPFPLQGGDVTQFWYADNLNPPEQWDALPFVSKVQIILFVGFLEWWSEYAVDKHYMRGGKPGEFPSFEKFIKDSPHPFPFLDLYDPLGTQKNRDPEKKAKGLLTEINNGRLAMLGIMGFLAEEKVPGAVPLLKGLITPYAGEVMQPF